jgi:hypothetical protein
MIELLEAIDELTDIIDELKEFEQELIKIPEPESRTTKFILSEALSKVEKYVLQYEDQLIELQDQYVMVLREEE